MRRSPAPYLVLLVLLAASPAGAMPVVFDFEGETATSGGTLPRHPGALIELVLSQSGLTVTITRESGEAFDVHFSPGFPVPGAFGQQALDPFSVASSDTAMILNFSRGVSAVSVDMGDFGDDGDTLALEAWSGADASGVQLARDDGSLPSGGTAFGFATLSVASTTPIWSLRMIGGSEFFPNSVFYDNLTVTPEPATGTLLMLAGASALGARARRPRGRLGGRPRDPSRA
jgi:hypothetical protein